MKTTKSTVAKTVAKTAAVVVTKTDALLATKVVATKKAADVRTTSLFGIMAAAAKKPVTLAALISTVTKAAKLRSEKDKAVVVATRIRAAYNSLGLLKTA